MCVWLGEGGRERIGVCARVHVCWIKCYVCMCVMVVVVVVDKDGCAQGRMISLIAQQHTSPAPVLFF